METSVAPGSLPLVALLTQVAGAALISLLFVLLQRHASRNRPFKLWSLAWLAVTTALVALVPWMRAGAMVDPAAAPRFSLPWWGLGAYQLGKLTFLLLLLLGLLAFTHGIAWRRWLGLGAPAVVTIALASLVRSDGLDDVIAVQAPVVVAVTGAGALLLALLPPLRRSLGTRVTAWALALLAALWTANVLDLWQPAGGYAWPALVRAAAIASDYGAFGDIVLQILLGLGMVVILFEELMREANAARDELAISHRHLERQTYLDPLTGAFNRAALEAGHGLGLAASKFGVVVVFDLDELKAVNDVHGHAAGDALLRHFAETVRGLLRTSDSLYRVGGDEFVAVLPQASLAEVTARLADAMDRSPGARADDGTALDLRASLGAASFTSGATLDAAIATADRRMLDAKRQRRLAASRSA